MNFYLESNIIETINDYQYSGINFGNSDLFEEAVEQIAYKLNIAFMSTIDAIKNAEI